MSFAGINYCPLSNEPSYNRVYALVGQGVFLLFFWLTPMPFNLWMMVMVLLPTPFMVLSMVLLANRTKTCEKNPLNVLA